MGGGLRARIRGIYATALTRLLLDHGVEVVQPSEEIVERFGSTFSEDSPDMAIRDRPDLQGVEASGSVEALDALRSLLGEELLDVVFRRAAGIHLDVEFPWASKTRLDDYRRLVAPTVPGHHFYKACGGAVSSAAEMAERLLLRGRHPGEVEGLLRRTVEPHLPFEGSEVCVEHVKLSGYRLSLGRAVIEAYEEGSRVTYRREMQGGSLYDGLGVAKEAGDRAVTEARLGAFHMVTKYFSDGGRFKGAYINLSTPLELYPSRVRYVDLEVDVCVWPGGDVQAVDAELLERAAAEGAITGRLLEAVREETDEILARHADGSLLAD